ncbi:MAG: TA system VapC family ribonuclease toxin [Ornithinimicrobium sp.]|uniref:TA system VapC family ribonuclease toxin n=1 Tax=Ornithinimicrobium sp. TaxID=1977084 RepID=UPI003D9BD89B
MRAARESRPIHLLDANVLIALAAQDHAHHESAQRWLAGVEGFAVCPITEGALVRFLLREGESAAMAQSVVAEIHAMPGSEFWPDDVSYRDADLAGVHGHRQVTDSYLVAMATARPPSQLATFDMALAARRPEACELVPTVDPVSTA